MNTWASSRMTTSDSKASDLKALRSLLKVQEDVHVDEPLREPLNHYLFECYREDNYTLQRKVYYLAKPFMPRQLQLVLRRMFANRQARVTFPRWPIEPILVEALRLCLHNTLSNGNHKEIYRIAPWPRNKKFAFTITHDVEWAEGLKNAPVLAEVERKLGVKGAWNIVPERYPIDWRIIERLRSEGHEIGVQGLRHDGMYFFSRKVFERRAKKIRSYALQWGASGYRSPSTLRKAEWMPDLGFFYDSSIPDTDPYEPQPGGCCCIWPFFIKDLVELPLTMPQDHTLFEILGREDTSAWEQKADWLAANSGLVLLTVHPDYVYCGKRLQLYEKFLSRIMQQSGVWHALPFEIASWWRQRNASTLRVVGGKAVVEGPAADRAAIIRTRLVDGVLEDEYLA